MKVIQFTVPVANQGSVVVQEDILPYFYNYLHRHSEVQITSIIVGEGTLIVGNYTQPFKAGEVYVIGPNQPHMFKGDPKYFEENNQKNIHAIHIFFDNNKINPLLQLPEFEQIQKFISNIKGSLHLPPEHANKATVDILRISKLGGLQRLILLAKLLNYFAVHAGDLKSLTTGISPYAYTESEGIRMNDIFQYTVENFSEQISLTKIAAIAHMTPHAFCKYFKRHTRKTYLSFLNEIRINEACKLLLKGKADAISTTAYSAGFNSAITFNRVFKKITGMTPSDYIRAFKFKDKSEYIADE